MIPSIPTSLALVSLGRSVLVVAVLIGPSSDAFARATGGARAADIPFLGPPVPVSVGTGTPRNVALGDFDGDSKLDLVATDSAADSISVCLGTGSGGFGPVLRFATGGPPWAVAVADFNRDGRLDVVTANTNATASILLGDGAGNLLLSNSYPTGPNAHVVVHVARLVGASGDLLLGTRRLVVLPGAGDGTFGPFLDLGENSLRTDVQAADVDGDGTSEIITSIKFYCGESHGGGCSAPVPGNVVVYKSDGSAAYTPIAVFGEISPYSDYQWVEAADVNGNGVVDIVTAGAYAWWSFLGTGSGGFPAYQWSAGPGPSGRFLLGDLSNDGIVDVVGMNAFSPAGLAVVYLGTGQGGFAFHSASGQAAGSPGASGELGDLNDDGFLDLVQASPVTNGVNVFLNNGPELLGVLPEPSPSGLRVTILSNPARSGLRASVFLPVKSPALVHMLDIGGRVLLERSVAGEGWHHLDFGNAAGRTAGVYFVRALQEGASSAAKVMVVP